MEIRFDGKRALVTGAGKGIGRALAKALLEGGAETYALSRTQADLDSLKLECPTIHTLCVDLTDWDATRKAVQDIGAIDLLVNNAGVSVLVPFLETTQETIDDLFNIHVKAVFNVSQVVAKGMVQRGQGGAIVNISSERSYKAGPGRAAYGSSKAAVDQLTRVMALELGPHQIRVNAVNPTVVLTRMGREACADPVKWARRLKGIPMGRFLEEKEVVEPVLYLLSDKADMINGVTLPLDGGGAVC